MHAGHVSSPGFRNIQNVVRRVKSGRSPYHLVECMACPGGCANGGGQPRPPPLEATDRAARVERLMSDADETRLRAPADNPAVRALYASGGFLEGGPLGAAAQQHLLTELHAREGEVANPLAISW